MFQGDARPLAERLRPQNLQEFLGQHRILGDGSLLRVSISQDRIPSMIFWGPPGCGKTSLAHLIRQQTNNHFEFLSAVSSGIKEVKEVIQGAKDRRHNLFGKGTILFIDEIHRFNKSQQDALLQAVEEGTITLIGATTENPSFEVNSALLSRCQLVLFAPLAPQDLAQLVDLAFISHPRGLQLSNLEISPEVVDKIVAQSDGDARFLLNQVEWIASVLPVGSRKIDLALLDQIQYHKPLRYDKHGEEHYNLISALHKSIRGSDPQAALYWARRMLSAGEDPRYLLRRLIRMSVEDIGLADPQALVQASAAQQAYDFLGVPEGLLAIDQLVVYVATAPKSNRVYMASKAVLKSIEEQGTLPVPRAFRNAVNRTGRDLGYGRGYEYDHDQPYAYSGQEHLPQALAGQKFYEPSSFGFEKEIGERMRFWHELSQGNSLVQPPDELSLDE